MILTLCRYKKISCIVVRGTYFCPAAVACLSEYLNIPTNNMIIGVPGIDFPFSLDKLGGVRLAVPRIDPSVRRHTCNHLRNIVIETPHPQPQQYDGGMRRRSHNNQPINGLVTLTSVQAQLDADVTGQQSPVDEDDGQPHSRRVSQEHPVRSVSFSSPSNDNNN